MFMQGWYIRHKDNSDLFWDGVSMSYVRDVEHAIHFTEQHRAQEYLNDRPNISGVLMSFQKMIEAPSQTGGVKHDAEKDPWHLAPYDAIRCIVKVLAFGAKKYAARNWEKGMDWSRCYRACIGHLTDWWQTGEPDAETSYSHLWHAGCCILFLIAYELRGIGKDDRPNRNPVQ